MGRFPRQARLLASPRTQRPDPSDAIEVVIVVEQNRINVEGLLRDQAVDRGSDGQSTPAAVEKDACGVEVLSRAVAKRQQFLRAQVFVKGIPLTLVGRALERFASTERRNRHPRVLAQELVQPIDGGVGGAAEKADEDRGVE